MLWACCTVPSLSLEIFEAGDAPRAIYDGPQQRTVVHAVNAAALAAGVRPGQTVAAARALCATLECLRRDVAAESLRLETLAALAYARSSQIVLDPPDAVLLEVGASLRLFGGWPAIRDTLRERLQAEGHQLRIALAPTPLAARLLADIRDGAAVANTARLKERLASVPLTQARLDDGALAMLTAIGVRTLGEARALPAGALARRTGRELIAHLDRLYGDAPDPRPFWQPPRRIELRCEFEYGIETSPALRFPLQRLTRELARHLQARDASVLNFQLQFGHEGEPTSSMAVGLRVPVRSADALFDAARGRLEQHPLAAPAHWLALVADDLPPFAPRSPDLFDAAERGALGWDALVERLRARLGDDAVNQPTPWPDHRPEHAWRRLPERGHEAAPAISLPRPMWLLPQPQPLRARIVKLHGEVERIESGWWDGDDVRRDYVIADLDSGQRAWLFREAGRDGDWMVHGWFA
jgi:protein ImuB